MSHTDFLILGYGVPALLLLAELVMLARQRRHHTEGSPDTSLAHAPADTAEEDSP